MRNDLAVVSSTLKERLARKTGEPTTGGCRLWLGKQNSMGYGLIFVGRTAAGQSRFDMAHRAAYEMVKGAIPAGKVLDHLCRTPLCVNPDHLEAVSQRENMQRGPGAMASCRKGHPFTPATTGRNYAQDGTPHRYCLVCRKERRAKYAAAKEKPHA